jgi:hypothetical protein
MAELTLHEIETVPVSSVTEEWMQRALHWLRDEERRLRTTYEHNKEILRDVMRDRHEPNWEEFWAANNFIMESIRRVCFLRLHWWHMHAIMMTPPDPEADREEDLEPHYETDDEAARVMGAGDNEGLP